MAGDRRRPAALASGFLEPGMPMITKPFAMEALATRTCARPWR